MDNDKKKQAASLRKEVVAAKRRSHLVRVRVARACGSIIVLALVFALGFFLRGFDPVATRLGLSSVSSGATTTSSTTIKTAYDSLSPRVSEVEDLLKEKSFDSYDLDTATSKMMNALVGVVDDPYMRYFTESQYQQYVRENKSSSYKGIGVLFAEYEGVGYAADVFAGSEAALAGVQVGDTVQAIDGDARTKWTVNEITSLISSREDSTVVITWSRPASMGASGGTTFTTTLQCQEYKESNVTAAVEDEVGYISITQLSQTSSDMVKSAVTQCQTAGARALVLDLRNCSGGYLSQAVDIASLFVKSGTLVQIKTSTSTTNKTASGNQISTLPMVVLINERTAAAAEVLAAALRDNGVARLVGVTTLGKGSVQVMQTLTFGGALRYTAAYYLSPLGHDINGLGVSPDIVVDDVDSQLSVATQTAQSYMTSGSIAS